MLTKYITQPWLIFIFLLLALPINIYADPLQSIKYQGYLTNSGRLPITDIISMEFRLYDSESDGILLWNELVNVDVNKGLFTVALGSITNPLPKSAMQNPMWLGLAIAGDEETSPRYLMNSLNNAFSAEDSTTLNGRAKSTFQDRITGLCPPGQAIAVINADGSVVCEIDNDTTYSGNDFALSNQSCQLGQVITGTDAAGNFTCSNAAISNTNKLTEISADIYNHIGNNINPHNITAAQISALSLTALDEHAKNADAHHAVYSNQEVLNAMLANDGAGSGLDTAFLDGIKGTSFLRSDTNDNYTNGTLIFDSGSTLALNGITQIGSASSTDDDSLYFDNGSSEFLRWSEATQGFELSDDLLVPGALTVGPNDGTAYTYNRLSNNTVSVPVSGDITSRGDLFIAYDLEVGGQFYANRFLYMDGSLNSGQDADQTIYFYDNNDRRAEYLRWNDFEGRFDVSDHLRVDGYLVSENDVFVQRNLHVAGTAKIGYRYSTYSKIPLNFPSRCHLYLGGDCYWGSAYMTCQAGERVLNGGCSCTDTAGLSSECHITDNLQKSYNTWICAASSPYSTTELTAFITCGRIDE